MVSGTTFKGWLAWMGPASIPAQNIITKIVFPCVMALILGILFFSVYRAILNINSNNPDMVNKGKKQLMTVLVSIVVVVIGPMIVWGMMETTFKTVAVEHKKTLYDLMI